MSTNIWAGSIQPKNYWRSVGSSDERDKKVRRNRILEARRQLKIIGDMPSFAAGGEKK